MWLLADPSAQADPSAFIGPDVWEVDRKASHGPESITYELASSIDVQGKRLPSRQVLRDSCPYGYRVWTGGAWRQSECPYSGGACFKADGTPTGDPALDDCGRRMSDCILRYGNAPLPLGNFPGVSRGDL